MKGLSFIAQFFSTPRTVGALLPSSKYLADKMMASIHFDSADCIVELGPGSGVFTEQLVKRRKRDTILLLIESNAQFCKLLQDKFGAEKNLYIINGSAEYMGAYLEKHHISRPDYIVSGLPFASLPAQVSAAILTQAKMYLQEDGRFITFQYTLFKKELFERYFAGIDIGKEICNFPPAYVLNCR